MMEDARYSISKLNSEIRRTGYVTNRLIVPHSTVYDGSVAVYSSSGSFTIKNDASPGAVLSMGTDEVIKGSSNASAPLSDYFIISYQTKDSLELSNNKHSTCVKDMVKDVSELDNDSQVISILFYVAYNAASGSNALFCQSFRSNLNRVFTQSGTAKALISNVERMRVLYGESNPAGGILYRNHTQVSDWTNITSVRISLALKSAEKNISSGTPGNYTMNGKLAIAPTNASEKRLYRVFSTTIAIRNFGL